MNTPIPTIVKDTSLSMMLDGKMVTINNAHINYTRIVDAVKAGEWDSIPAMLNVAAAIDDFGQGMVKVENGVVLYNGEALHNSLTVRMISMLREGFNIDPMVMFLENLMQNPSHRAVNELYDFLESGDLPLTDDGHFLAYKNVRANYTDIHSGKFDNSIGAKPSEDRNKVDEDKDRTCSKGLHFCSESYLPNFSFHSDGHTMIVKINPRDVVAIPSDYNNAKGRCCLYEVVGEVDMGRNYDNKPFTSPVYTSKDVEHVGQSSDWKRGYSSGKEDAISEINLSYGDPEYAPDWSDDWNEEFSDGYEQGYADVMTKHWDDLEEQDDNSLNDDVDVPYLLEEAQTALEEAEKGLKHYMFRTRAYETGVRDGKVVGGNDAANYSDPNPISGDLNGTYGIAYDIGYYTAYLAKLELLS